MLQKNKEKMAVVVIEIYLNLFWLFWKLNKQSCDKLDEDLILIMHKIQKNKSKGLRAIKV